MWVFLSLSDDSESVETQKEGKKKEIKRNWRGWSNQNAGVCSKGKKYCDGWECTGYWSPHAELGSMEPIRLWASLCRTKATVSGVILYQLQLYPFNVVVKRKGEQEVRRGKNVAAAVDATTQHYSFSVTEYSYWIVSPRGSSCYC